MNGVGGIFKMEKEFVRFPENRVFVRWDLLYQSKRCPYNEAKLESLSIFTEKDAKDFAKRFGYSFCWESCDIEDCLTYKEMKENKE